MAQVLREQKRITKPGGVLSAVACFCHSDGLPHYHGRYPLPGNHRIDLLNHKLWQVFRRAIRPGLLGVDHDIVNQDLAWEFKAAGLEEIQVNGHLTLVSPGDSRIPFEEAIGYALARHEMAMERVLEMQEKYGPELAEAGFSQADFEELLELKQARDGYLKADPSRVREVMEVYTDTLIIVRGIKPGSSSREAH